MDQFRITDEQKKILAEYLPNIEELCQGDIDDLLSELNFAIIGNMDKEYNPTPISEKLQAIYDEINNYLIAEYGD